MKNENLKAWERLSSESDAAFSAFKIYLELDERKLQKVAEMLQKNPAVIRRWAKKYYWKDRAAAYHNSLLEEERNEKIRRRKKDIERQNKIGQLLLSKAVEILQNADTKRGTFYAATQMAELGCKLVNEAYDLGDEDNKDSEVTINIRRADNGN